MRFRTVRPLQRCDGSNSRRRDDSSQRRLFGAGSCLTGETTAIGSGGRTRAVGGRQTCDPVDETRQLKVGRNCLPEQIIDQHRVGELQKAGQRVALLGRRPWQLAAGEALQEHIQFLHTATAAPQEAASFRVEGVAPCKGAGDGLGVGGHCMYEYV